MEIIASIAIIVLGCLGHFLFEWCSHAKIAGIFFAVNESTWEHIKLVIYPSLLWIPVEIIAGGEWMSVISASFIALVVSILLIPGLFYGYTAITHKNWLIPDIICFIIAVVAGRMVYSATVGLEFCASPAFFGISCVGLAVIILLYLTLSYHAPHNFLFRDPIMGKFGPCGHECHSHFHNQ